MHRSSEPDVGQVEADPLGFGLTAFETKFEEQRPFFREGGSFFKKRDKLFHSRRIGETPSALTRDEGEVIERPAATTIRGA